MTPQQELLVLTMLTKLADAQLAKINEISYCLFCSKTEKYFEQIKHSDDCIVMLAKKLKDTLKEQ